MEFCSNGALKNYLERYKTTKGKVIDKKRNPPPEFGELKEFCEHIASGDIWGKNMAHIDKVDLDYS